MPSGPIEEAIKGLLAEATVATAKRDWVTVSSLVGTALKLDPENADALELKSLAVNNGVSIKALLLDSAAATAKMDWNRVSWLANTVLELEPDNIDALKFKSLSSDHVVEPKTISEKVQQALAANEQAKAEALIRVHLTENPDDQEGLKAQNVVLEARQKQRVQQVVNLELPIMSEQNSSNPTSSHRLSNSGIGLGLFAILLFPPLFGLLGIVFGALGMVQGDKQRGITAIVVSVVGTILGSLAGGLAT